MKKKSPLKIFLKVSFLIIAAFLAYHFIDFKKFFAALSNLSFSYVLILLGIVTADRLLMAIKWFHLALGIGIRFPFLECIKAYYAASFLNYFVPTSLSGDILRAERMSKSVGQKKDVYASLLMEKGVGLISIVVISWFGLFYFFREWNSPLKKNIAILLLLISIGVTIALFISLHPKIHARLINILNRYRVGKISDKIQRVYTAYLQFGRVKKHLFINFLVGLLENIVQFGIAYGATLGLGYEIGFIPFMAIMALATFVRRLAAYFDSWGFSETLTVAMFGLVGIEPSTALAIILLRHAVIVLGSLPGGLFLFGTIQPSEG